MCSTSVFTSIMAMVPNLVINFIISLFMLQLFLQMWQFDCVWLRYDLYFSVVNGITSFFLELIIFTECSLKDSKTFHATFTSPYICTYVLYHQMSISSNWLSARNHIIDIDYLQGICSPIFVVDNFQDYFCINFS